MFFFRVPQQEQIANFPQKCMGICRKYPSNHFASPCTALASGKLCIGRHFLKKVSCFDKISCFVISKLKFNLKFYLLIFQRDFDNSRITNHECIESHEFTNLFLNFHEFTNDTLSYQEIIFRNSRAIFFHLYEFMKEKSRLHECCWRPHQSNKSYQNWKIRMKESVYLNTYRTVGHLFSLGDQQSTKNINYLEGNKQLIWM